MRLRESENGHSTRAGAWPPQSCVSRHQQPTPQARCRFVGRHEFVSHRRQLLLQYGDLLITMRCPLAEVGNLLADGELIADGDLLWVFQAVGGFLEVLQSAFAFKVANSAPSPRPADDVGIPDVH